MEKLVDKLYILLVLLTLLFTSSCTNLDEEVWSSITSDNFYKTEEEIIAAMAPIYTDLQDLVQNRGIIDMEEYTSDIMLIPTRDYGGWYDGGYMQRYHEHTWTSETKYVDQVWSYAYTFVNRANMLIYQFNELDNMDDDLRASFIGELRGIRAYGYYCLLNNYGNVPLVTSYEDAEEYPANNTDFDAGRLEIFNYIESELLEIIPLLDEDNDNSTYGRMNKWAAMCVLIKLYMNAEVWTGTERWDDAITYATKLIESGEYELESDYFDNFICENESSTENIFVVPVDETLQGNIMTSWGYYMHQHFASGDVFGVSSGAWNGPTAIPSFIHTFDDDDLRLNGWSIGEQINQETGEVQLSTRSPYNELIYTVDYVNIFDETDETVYDYTNAMENNGARMCKYEIAFSSGSNMPNDLVVYRLADFILLKAEALLRKNGGTATEEAVELVNQIRNRAFEDPTDHLYTTSTLTLDSILAERARELYYEGHRRNDLIRYDKFARGDWEWYDRSNQGDWTNWFPIPEDELTSNPNLTQNPGYE